MSIFVLQRDVAVARQCLRLHALCFILRHSHVLWQRSNLVPCAAGFALLALINGFLSVFRADTVNCPCRCTTAFLWSVRNFHVAVMLMCAGVCHMLWGAAVRHLVGWHGVTVGPLPHRQAPTTMSFLNACAVCVLLGRQLRRYVRTGCEHCW